VKIGRERFPDSGMLRGALYIDGHRPRMFGAATIDLFGSPADGWFRVLTAIPV
jgi:hypothetical protein